MNVLLRLALLGAAVAVGPSSAFAAPVVTVEGFVGRGAEPVTGVFTATIEVTTDAGEVLVAGTVPSFELVDGRFSTDLDLADAAATLADGETVTVAVDLGEGLTGIVRLGRVYAAGSAGRASRALNALSADSLGDIPGADLVPDGSLAVPLAFANITSLPPGIDDGVDNGTVDTLTGLAVVGGVLDVASGGVTDIVAGSLTSAQLADGSVTSLQLGALAADRVANGTLTGANFASGAITAPADVKGTRSVSRRPAGCDRPFDLTVASTCNRRTCTISGVDCTANICRIPCGGGSCANLGTAPSTLSLICVLGTNEFRGRLMVDP